MTKINYTAAEPALRVGIPYTWGEGSYWYMKCTNGNVVCLNTGACVNKELHSDADVQDYRYFRYAASMELN